MEKLYNKGKDRVIGKTNTYIMYVEMPPMRIHMQNK